MSQEVKRHPLNVKGKYYVDYDACLDHECCVVEAPNNFRIGRQTWGAYIFKQPETSEEEAQCNEAKMCCPVEAIFDDGET